MAFTETTTTELNTPRAAIFTTLVVTFTPSGRRLGRKVPAAFDGYVLVRSATTSCAHTHNTPPNGLGRTEHKRDHTKTVGRATGEWLTGWRN